MMRSRARMPSGAERAVKPYCSTMTATMMLRKRYETNTA